jgi:predicted nucleotidyltransferase
VLESVRSVLMEDPTVRYALVFGSCARGTAHEGSDLDVAIGTDRALGVHELGDLIARLESKSGRTVDLVLLDEAPPALAYRVFRDGVVVVERDRPALVRRKAKAILDYLDFKPFEDLCVRGVLAAAARNGR